MSMPFVSQTPRVQFDMERYCGAAAEVYEPITPRLVNQRVAGDRLKRIDRSLKAFLETRAILES